MLIFSGVTVRKAEPLVVLTSPETKKLFDELTEPIVIKLTRRRGWIKMFTDGSIFTAKAAKGPWSKSFAHFDPSESKFVAKNKEGEDVKFSVQITGFSITIIAMHKFGLIPIAE